MFGEMLSRPGLMSFWMIVVVALGFGICSMGLQNGVERITKLMMLCLLAVMVVLVFRSVTLPGAAEGLQFYLMPDFRKIVEQGLGTVVFAAMGQAFFTLSLGIGAMAIFGSYIDKDRSLRSIPNETMFSKTAMTVERAAKVINTKKREPHRRPPTMVLKIFGRVMKIRLGPSSATTYCHSVPWFICSSAPGAAAGVGTTSSRKPTAVTASNFRAGFVDMSPMCSH